MSLRRLLLLGLVACLPIVHPAVAADDAPEATLMVSGKSTLKVPADQVSLMLGVEAASVDPDQAHADASATMDALVKAMKKLGLKPSTEFTIERYTVDQQWSPRPRNADPTWRPTIVGYRVSSSMQITTTRIELAGTLIANAVDAGANDIGQLVFGLADPRTSRGEAIDAATQNAIEDAKRLAAAAGVELHSIQSLNLDGAAATPRFEKYGAVVAGRSMAMDSAPIPPVMSGDVTVQANVTLVWNISGP